MHGTYHTRFHPACSLSHNDLRKPLNTCNVDDTDRIKVTPGWSSTASRKDIFRTALPMSLSVTFHSLLFPSTFFSCSVHRIIFRHPVYTYIMPKKSFCKVLFAHSLLPMTYPQAALLPQASPPKPQICCMVLWHNIPLSVQKVSHSVPCR